MGYDGGKGQAGVTQWIINQIPAHRVYIEPFVGGGAVLRMKRPACSSIVIDADAVPLDALRGCCPDHTVLIQDDAIEWLWHFMPRGDEFVYCDPPYVRSTRSWHRDLYRCELTDQDHRKLLDAVDRLECPVMISGYWSELYASSLSAWRTAARQVVNRRGKRALEWLWMNYPEPAALHDYRFLGSNFREREKIHRRIARWRRRLDSMPILEKRALQSALSDDRSSPDPA